MKYKGKNLFLILDQKFEDGFLFLADWKRSPNVNYICIVDNPEYANKIFRIEDFVLSECPISPVINERRAKRPLPFRKVAESLLIDDGEIDMNQIEEEAKDYSSVYAAKAVFRFHQMFPYPGFGNAMMEAQTQETDIGLETAAKEKESFTFEA